MAAAGASVPPVTPAARGGGSSGSAALVPAPRVQAPPERFGSEVPFAEPPDLQGQYSPYYNEQHLRWRWSSPALALERGPGIFFTAGWGVDHGYEFHLAAQISADFILISSWPPGVVSDYLLKVVRRSFGKS